MDTTVELTPAQAVEKVERGFGLSAPDLARALQLTPRAIESWVRGESIPPPEPWQRLAEWARLYDRLVDTFTDGPRGAEAWLRTPHRYLGGQTPADMARQGRFDRVAAALGVLEWGIFI